MFAAFSVTAFSQQSHTGDSIYKNFLTPPDAAKPRVWWHWMNGNITQDGIRKDLEWMHRVGIGGFQNFDAALATPQIVEKRLTYMTPDWQAAFKLTAKLADSLHLEMAIAGSPGWSESGGSWVKPEDGMKKIVWTEMRVKGGTSNIKILPQQGITGPFQNIVMQPGFGEAVEPEKLPVFYKDIAVIAYKLPEADKSLTDLGAVVTSSGGSFTLAQLTDGDLSTTSLLPRDSATGFGWIQFAFPQPQTIKAITIVGGGKPGTFGFGAAAKDSRKLEASDDGVNYKFVCIIPPGAILQQTIAITPTTAKYFRVTINNPPPPVDMGAAFGMGGMGKIKDPGGTPVAEINLHTADVINCFEEKDAFAPVGDLNTKLTASSNDAVSTNNIVDLTNKMNADGTVNWTAPEGEWKVVRFGYSLLGITNHPASPEATGLEVDKLDPVAVKNYFETYLDQYKSATGGLMGSKGGLQYMVTDSWEAGAQNWTANLPAEFQKRRGYSIMPWLPVITGEIVESAEASEKFLFDFRKTLSEMVAEYHYDALTKILAARGMKRYSESHENGRAFIADGMDVKRTAAVPMSALWTPNPFINQNDQTAHTIDIRESASVAHIFGQNLVAAESLTALGIGGTAWSYYPGNLKPSVDLELASGLNRFVIHCSVHQPVDDKIPGLGLGPFGQWYTRHETWAEQATAWNAYLSRSSYLLQQGKFVADIVYYYGEDNNITNLFGKHPPAIPEGYNYDYINAYALINLLSVKNGILVTPSGMRYRVLVLDSNAARMSLPVLKKINELVKAGATVTGIKPVTTLGLSDDRNEFNKLVSETWSSSNTKVTEGKPVGDVLNTMNIAPDFTYTKPQADMKLLYVHRTLPDRDIYWINNRSDKNENTEAAFRITGKVPVIWHAETGATEPASYNISGGITKVKLHLSPNDAVFVIFKDKAESTSFTLPATEEKELATIEGSWNVSFQPNRGAPATATFDKLSSYTENADEGIKYFSGTASYTKTIAADKSWFAPGAHLWLNLGDVKNIAEVIVNGKSLGIVWKQPFSVDITSALKAGENKIEVKVTNLWVNRLIGDSQPNVAHKITYTTMPFYQASSKLLPSGLLGPVQILSVK
ncbi:F5/8 type C domain-containing protein [Parafilimonas terrae]|uniref:F5/8 type C domain-containing protein n=2 Tax=Parafilimonas terrae TaxID=1465490 RepID=A0A1I5U920_9BACT|nr:F5/8 type C domain-containing protein [Parafilimonas terrae]